MKILVTGATGFIGSYVVNLLVELGYQVIATSRKAEKAKMSDWYGKVIYLPLDIDEIDFSEDYFSFFHEPDCAIHLAWSGLPNYKSLVHIEKNLMPNYFFIKNLIENGLRQILVAGTCFEYGMQNGCLSEGMTTNPDNAYALAKDSLRRYVAELSKYNSFIFQWTRLFYMYGKGQNSKSIIPLLDTALEKGDAYFNMSGGEQIRDYLHIKEVAKNIVNIATQKEIDGVINCCSGKPISIRNLVERRLKEKNKNINLELGYYPYPDYEPFAFWGDVEKLNKIKNNARSNSGI